MELYKAVVINSLNILMENNLNKSSFKYFGNSDEGKDISYIITKFLLHERMLRISLFNNAISLIKHLKN